MYCQPAVVPTMYCQLLCGDQMRVSKGKALELAFAHNPNRRPFAANPRPFAHIWPRKAIPGN